MQHFFNFAIELDDDRIVDSVSTNAEKQIIKELTDQIKERLFCGRYNFRSNSTDYNGQLSEYAKEIMLGWLADNKQEIIDKTAELLAKRLSTTKAAKDMKEAAKC